MTYVKINGLTIEATVNGLLKDSKWNDRESAAITCSLSYKEAIALFVDGVQWSIVHQPEPYQDENGETVTPEAVEYDNSDFSVAGDITDHRDGTITVKMGKLTDLEETLAIIYGGAE